jgi:hypothetical protein
MLDAIFIFIGKFTCIVGLILISAICLYYLDEKFHLSKTEEIIFTWIATFLVFGFIILTNSTY